MRQLTGSPCRVSHEPLARERCASIIWQKRCVFTSLNTVVLKTLLSA